MSDTQTQGAAATPAATQGTNGQQAPAAPKPADQALEIAAKLKAAEAELAALKAKADPTSDAADRLHKIERKGFNLDLRDAGIPRELIPLIAMPAEESARAAAVEQAKATFAAAVAAEITKRQANASPSAPGASAPINPATPQPPPPAAPTDWSAKYREQGPNLKPRKG
jgi:ParB-like chromosome segregation protein Spo0J